MTNDYKGGGVLSLTDQSYSMTGRLTVYTGPMYAGKSTALLDAISGSAAAVAVKPALDDRYDEERIVSHDGEQHPALVVGTDAKRISQLQDRIDVESVSTVAIDEAQFFDEALVTAARSLLEGGVDVHVAGLDRDFRGEPFGPLPNLIALADDVHYLTARCDACGADATRTQRLIDGEPAPVDAPTVEVGGEEKYEARCPEHHEVPGSDNGG